MIGRLLLRSVVLALVAAPLALPGVAEGQEATTVCPSSVDDLDEGWVCMVYLIGLSRSPSDAEVAYWVDVAAARGRLAVSDGVFFSQEGSEVYAHDLYDALLGRTADPAELARTASQIRDARSELVAEGDLLVSDEFVGGFDTTEAFVENLYTYYFGRDSDPDGLAFWSDRIRTPGVALLDVVQAFQHHAEAGAVVATISYDLVLSREPDPAGLAFWQQVGQVGGLDRVVVEMLATNEVREVLGAEGVCAADASCETAPIARARAMAR